MKEAAGVVCSYRSADEMGARSCFSMSLFALFIAIPLVLVMTGGLFAMEHSFKIFDSKGRNLSLAELAKEALRADAVFFGEFHDNKTLHELESVLLEQMWRENRGCEQLKKGPGGCGDTCAHCVGEKVKTDGLARFLALSLEMFERDTQRFLDDYRENRIDENEFLKSSRPWPNYRSDYRPLVEFAKKHGMPIIAANVPRRLASLYTEKGTLDGIGAEDSLYVAKNHLVLEGPYMKEFFKTMETMSEGEMGKAKNAHMSEMPKQMLMRYYGAQCLKDDTMAESISSYMTKWPGTVVFHINGDFHSRNSLGTVEKLKLDLRGVKTLVITPVLVEKGKPFVFDRALSKEGDVLLMVRPTPDKAEQR
jgi:uncharacterized iron-regulated protein